MLAIHGEHVAALRYVPSAKLLGKMEAGLPMPPLCLQPSKKLSGVAARRLHEIAGVARGPHSGESRDWPQQNQF